MSKDNREYTNRMLEDSIDESIINYIDEYVDVTDTKLNIAIIVYIKLCELFWYDPEFIVDNDYDLVDSLSEISVENNEVICLHWAIIYARLLDRYGVSNELLGDDSHLRVRVNTSEFIMFADATKYGVECRDYLLSDLTNTKLGIKICNLATLSTEKNKELNVVIEEVYKKLGIPCYDMSRIDNLVEKFRIYIYRRLRRKEDNGEVVIDKKEIDKRIAFINRFYYVQKELHEVERLQFFSKYYRSVFEGLNFDSTRCLTMCECDGDKKSLLKLLVAKDDSGKVYYYLETEHGFAEYEKDELIDILVTRGIYFKYDRVGVLGFDDGEVKRLLK